MTGILDYGVGNLFSLRMALSAIGEETVVTADAAALRGADRLILPGVGAFGDAAEKLSACGLSEFLRARAGDGVPILGICLGMQLLFSKSHEFGTHAGLGLLPGEVVSMEGRLPEGLRIPQIGWNALYLHTSCPLFSAESEGEYVYFVHSYFAECPPEVLTASTDYGIELCAAAARGNVFGCQFHPEKSGEAGQKILRAFCALGGNA